MMLTLPELNAEKKEKLLCYESLLKKWNAKINLVSKETIDFTWNRHIEDSLQLHDLLPDHERTLYDIGTGAGFPGMVFAIMGWGDIHLLESDERKCAFLREAARQTDAELTIHNQRAEEVALKPCDVITARAVASLEKLCALFFPFLHEKTLCIVPKGKDVVRELKVASRSWHFTYERYQSITDAHASVLCLKGVRRKT